MSMRELDNRELRFVDEYFIDCDAKRAALAAGYSKTVANSKAYQWVSNSKVKPHVFEEIERRRESMSKRLQIDADWVVERWTKQVIANPADLIQYRRGCCRYCWGEHHLYQWTEGELIKAQEEAELRSKPAPDDRGGTDYDKKREPNPSCPACGGEGVGRIYATDTRNLPESAKAIFAGVRQGKDGLEIKMHNQQEALANIAKHLGMFPSRVEVSGSGGGPIQHQNVPPNLSALSDEELALAISLAEKSAGESGGAKG